MAIKRLILFFILNFTALYLGSLLTDTGTASWYMEMNRAPWSPPGWVFGVAWTFIMVCYSFYMAQLVGTEKPKKTVIALYAASWILNVSWNPIFFYLRNITLGLVVIVTLAAVILSMLVGFRKELEWKSLLIAPYFIWLCIATSLNLYAYLYN